MPNDRDFPFADFSEDAQTNLPIAPARDDDDDDGIFIHWPGFDTEDGVGMSPEAKTDPDGEDTDTSEQDAPKQKKKREKKKPQKKKKKVSAEEAADEEEDADAAYAFRRAADSDLEESRGKRRTRIKDESDNESTLSSIKYYKHTAKLKEIFLRRLLPTVLVLVFVIGFVLYFFRLQSLTFVNLRGYDAEDVFRAIDVRKNQFIFSISDSEIEKRLRTEFPYIQDVALELSLPSAASLIFTEDSARFYTKIYDEYFVISQSMRVLERCSSEDELEDGLREITLPPVSYAVVGHSLRFFDASYLSFLNAFLDTMEQADIFRSIASMDLSNRFDIVLNYEDRVTVELGNDDNLETRLLFVKSTIDTLEDDQRGTLHIIDNKQAVFSPEARETD